MNGASLELGMVLAALLLVGIIAVVAQLVRRQPKLPTVLICGATGVGKSTLINALLGRAATEVGIGEPVTDNTERLANEAFAFYDSRGLEVEDASQTYLQLLSDLFRLRFARDVHLQVDLVVICIAEPSNRYDAAHVEIANLCEDLRIPYGIALTKAEDNQTFGDVVREVFLSAQFVHPVRALALQAGAFVLPADGVDELRAMLLRFQPKDFSAARRRAAHASRAARMAQAAHDLVRVNSDEAWVNLTGSAYALLLRQPGEKWDQWLSKRRAELKEMLVPGLLKRWLFTKFDHGKLDAEISRRVFPHILRHFSHDLPTLGIESSVTTVKEAAQQLEVQRPYRSRFQ